MGDKEVATPRPDTFHSNTKQKKREPVSRTRNCSFVIRENTVKISKGGVTMLIVIVKKF